MNFVITVLLMAIVVVLLRNNPALVLFVLACYLIWKWFKRNNHWSQKQAELMAQDLKVKKGIYDVLKSLDARMDTLIGVMRKRSTYKENTDAYLMPISEVETESFSDHLL